MNPEKLSEGVLVHLRMGFWNARIKLSDEKINKSKNLPKDIVRGTQDLIIDRSIIDKLLSIRNRAKTILRENSMIFPIPGVYWIPKNKIQYLDDAFTELKKMYIRKTNELACNIDRLKFDFREKYPEFYLEWKYPNPKQIKAKFYFEWSFFSLQLPDEKSGLIPPSLYKKEQEKFQNMIKEMNDIAINVIGNELLKRIDSLYSQCEQDKFSAGTIKSFEKFMERWDTLWSGNIDDKSKMHNVIKRAKRFLSKTTVERLRTSEDFKNKTQAKIEKIANQIKNIPNFKLKRKLDV
jgi:hypothetical protein